MAESQGTIDNAVTIPTFVGSLLSFLASSAALILHVTFPPKRHFRHALIFNLLVADCINSLNNTISGAVVLANGYTRNSKAEATPGCVLNAWIGQISVQTVDFTILIISIVVLMTVFRTHILSNASTRSKIIVCVSAWIPGLITSNIGWGLDAYGHVSGNWCWIRSDQLGLRYALTHGWRIAIFIATIIIYTCIYIRLTRVFGVLRVGNTWSSMPSSKPSRSDADGTQRLSDSEGILVSQTYTVSHELESLPSPDPGVEESNKSCPPSDTKETGSLATPSYPPKTFLSTSSEAPKSTTMSNPRPVTKMPAPPNVRRMLLMNGYPIAYILLWIPGMTNRLVESICGSSPRWLTVMQATTQFVGFVNAMTYGYSEQLRHDLSLLWTNRRDFFRMRNS